MASANDLIKKVGASTVTTLAAPGKALSATSITVGSTTNWPTDTGVTFAIRVVDADGALVAGTYTEWKGTVTSGTTIAFNATPEYGSDQVYAAGSTTQVFIPLSSSAHNDLVDGLLAEHNQLDGTHTDITATSITATTGTFTNLSITGTASAEGWSPLGQTPNTVTPNGNRSYDLVFNGTDLTDTLTNGMRLRTARTVAAPTQCTSLNGTTQYYSKSSPNKMTFTDDFCVSAWVKLTSYGATSIIVSRFNNTSGWRLYIESDGRLALAGFNNSSSNSSLVRSHQSIPLNKWVHVAAQLDMSAFTATATTSYVMIDGVDVPAVVARAGTNPTTLIQAGNLEIGSNNGGTELWPGKIAQVAVYSAKVTQAVILAAMNQGLVGTETSLASAYSFSNSITDLNTTTPNDLTANGSAVATNADSPFGNSGISTTLDYAIVMANSFSTNTTLTVQVPEGCTIPTSGGVSTVDYSTQSVPYGFPRASGKWTVGAVFLTSVATGGLSNGNFTYGANQGAALIPVGAWNLSYVAPIAAESVSSTDVSAHVTLSSSSSTVAIGSEEDSQMSVMIDTIVANHASRVGSIREKDITLTSATTYYRLVGRLSANLSSISLNNNYSASYIKARNAYV